MGQTIWFAPLILFQSALPRGERLPVFQYQQPIPKFQSALPRGERRGGFVGGLHPKIISIRAPARGATKLRHGDRVTGTISIRAPARGATQNSRHWRRCKRFQSALPRGERHFAPILSNAIACISIRAPARGATKCAGVPRLESVYFNPRSREGSDDGL